MLLGKYILSVVGFFVLFYLTTYIVGSNNWRDAEDIVKIEGFVQT